MASFPRFEVVANVLPGDKTRNLSTPKPLKRELHTLKSAVSEIKRRVQISGFLVKAAVLHCVPPLSLHRPHCEFIAGAFFYDFDMLKNRGHYKDFIKLISPKPKS